MDIKRTAKSLSDRELAARRGPQTGFAAGYGATVPIYSELKDADRQQVLKLAARVVQDRQLVEFLGERVYRLLLEDLQGRRDRTLNYRGRF